MGRRTSGSAIRPRLDHHPAIGHLRPARRIRKRARRSDPPGPGHTRSRFGANKFEPVAVREVAEVYRAVLDDPAAIGQTYELGGGETYSYEEMLDVIAAQLGN